VSDSQPEVIDDGRLDAANAEMDWRPIETAPKDGTKIILWWNGRALEGYWLKRFPSDLNRRDSQRVRYEPVFVH
jgi:hypothetical protein